MKLDVGMALEPAVLFRLMRVQIVQHDMDLAARVLGHNLIHELQELTPPSTAVMRRLHLSGGDLKLGKQGGRAVTLIAVAESVHGLSIRQTHCPEVDPSAWLGHPPDTEPVGRK